MVLLRTLLQPWPQPKDFRCAVCVCVCVLIETLARDRVAYKLTSGQYYSVQLFFLLDCEL